MTSSNLFLASIVAVSIGTSALANPVRSLTADLDRDGRAETFQITDNGESETTLTIRRPGKANIVARNMVWSLEPASLERASNGSIMLKSSHMGIGRSAHEQILTIAFRNGAYQVVGITRSAWDKLNPDAGTGCDINLLTGRGLVNNRPVRRPARALIVTQWNMETPLPTGCDLS